jgi:hypothetical protein
MLLQCVVSVSLTMFLTGACSLLQGRARAELGTAEGGVLNWGISNGVSPLSVKLIPNNIYSEIDHKVNNDIGAANAGECWCNASPPSLSNCSSVPSTKQQHSHFVKQASGRRGCLLPAHHSGHHDHADSIMIVRPT